MGRKSVTDLKQSDKLMDEALEEFKSVSEVKYELAKEAYDLQDAKTRAVIDRIHKTLQVYATGYINLQLAPPSGGVVAVKIENEYLGYNLIYLAVEMVKDLAITGTRVANFKFPPVTCSMCGTDIPETTKRRR